jgi:prepilin-type processing-associated H-X9-DG protein
MAAVQDAVKYVICEDAGWICDDVDIGMLGYPDICGLSCGNSVCSWSGGPDGWDVMSDPSCCGDAAYFQAPFNGAFLANPELRKPYARHLGGVNIGFLDGHASWFNSDLVLKKRQDNELVGVDPWGPTSDCINTDTGNLWSQDYPNVPTIY